MSNRVTVKVDAGKTTGEQEHLWRWIGYDECNYTYIPEGKELLRKFAALEDAPLLCENPFYVLHGQLPREPTNSVPQTFTGRTRRERRFMILPGMTGLLTLIWRRGTSPL